MNTSATNTNNHALSLNSINAGYGDTQILFDVSMHVSSGETVVVIGPNGAGKSTTLKAIFKLANVTNGDILLNGNSILGLQAQEIVASGVGFVPQTNNIFTTMTIEENLEIGAFLHKGDYQYLLDKIYNLFPDLKDKRKQNAGVLSGGQRQMLAMSKAMMLEPKVLLLDEPTAGLSPKYRGEIFTTVKRICETGIPIIMVEQNAKQALTIADRAYVLVNGKNAYEGTGADLLANSNVSRMFLGAS